MLPSVTDQIQIRPAKDETGPRTKGLYTSPEGDTPNQGRSALGRGEDRPDFESIFTDEQRTVKPGQDGRLISLPRGTSIETSKGDSGGDLAVATGREEDPDAQVVDTEGLADDDMFDEVTLTDDTTNADDVWATEDTVLTDGAEAPALVPPVNDRPGLQTVADDQGQLPPDQSGRLVQLPRETSRADVKMPPETLPVQPDLTDPVLSETDQLIPPDLIAADRPQTAFEQDVSAQIAPTIFSAAQHSIRPGTQADDVIQMPAADSEFQDDGNSLNPITGRRTMQPVSERPMGPVPERPMMPAAAPLAQPLQPETPIQQMPDARLQGMVGAASLNETVTTGPVATPTVPPQPAVRATSAELSGHIAPKAEQTPPADAQAAARPQPATHAIATTAPQNPAQPTRAVPNPEPLPRAIGLDTAAHRTTGRPGETAVSARATPAAPNVAFPHEQATARLYASRFAPQPGAPTPEPASGRPDLTNPGAFASRPMQSGTPPPAALQAFSASASGVFTPVAAAPGMPTTPAVMTGFAPGRSVAAEAVGLPPADTGQAATSDKGPAAPLGASPQQIAAPPSMTGFAPDRSVAAEAAGLPPADTGQAAPPDKGPAAPLTSDKAPAAPIGPGPQQITAPTMPAAKPSRGDMPQPRDAAMTASASTPAPQVTTSASQPVANTAALTPSLQMAQAAATSPAALVTERFSARFSADPSAVLPDAAMPMTSLSETTAPLRGIGQTALNMPELPRHVAQQLMAGLQASSDKSADILLNPAELGRVRISLKSGDAGMVVSIVADRPETLELLRRNAEILAQEFHDIGYGSTEFSFGQDQGASAQGSGSDAQSGGQSGRVTPLGDPTTPQTQSAQSPAAPPSKPITLDRVDLRL